MQRGDCYSFSMHLIVFWIQTMATPLSMHAEVPALPLTDAPQANSALKLENDDRIQRGDIVHCWGPALVTILGPVAKQGKMDFIEGDTISQAIKRAGGFTSEPKRLTIVRKTPQGNKRILANLDAVFRLLPDFDLYLRNGDVLIVE